MKTQLAANTTERNKNLKELNTFGIDVKSDFYIKINNNDDLFKNQDLLNSLSRPLLIMGGGSNILFTKDFEGTIIHIDTKGIEVIHEDKNSVLVKSAAGEIWDDLVSFCVERNFCGLENLALIPGKVGSSPIQNIGAYGTEMKDTFEELEALEIETGEKRIFKKADCNFGYRYSIFKAELKNKFIITYVTFRLSKISEPNITYKALAEELKKSGVLKPCVKDIADIVGKIRKEKLPDPLVTGNAGSFFKNPVVDKEKFILLQKDFPEIVHFNQNDGKVKLAAAWLIEKCGWKGKTAGHAGVHHRQPLVLINTGGASGNEILELAMNIINDVKSCFDIELEPEVNII